MNRSRMLQRLLKPEELLLDTYSGATLAFSLRYLSSSFKGNDVILVRRSSDDAEEGFTPDEITDGTLTSFCGAGDGFVKVWYNQAGISNAVQNTHIRQPRIVNGGVVDNVGGVPALFVTDRAFSIEENDDIIRNVGYGQSYNVINKTGKRNFDTTIRLDPPTGGIRFYIRIRDDNHQIIGSRLDGDTFQTINASTESTGHFIFTGMLNYADAEAYLYRNNNLLASSTSFQTAGNTSDTRSVSRGLIAETSLIDSTFTDGNFQESILFSENTQPSFNDIIQNINDYYNVF